MQIDFNIGELEHIRHTVSKLTSIHHSTAKDIIRKIDDKLNPIKRQEALQNTQLGSARKPTN